MKTYKFNENNITYNIKEYSNGSKFWHLNRKLHRENGPAVELASGTKEWYKNGNRHRDDGPAVEWYDGYKKYYYNGKYSFKRRTKTLY